MGGRGASSGAKGAGGVVFTASGGLAIGTDKIEFDGDLVYYGDDARLTDEVRKAIEAFEQKRVKNKIEYAFAVDVNGNPVDTEKKGGSGSVKASYAMHEYSDTFSHNHPREQGGLGGTFSPADLRNFAKYGNKTVRATAKEGTYSISKGSNFDAAGFTKYVREVDAAHQKEYKQTLKTLNANIRNGKIRADEFNRANYKAFNTMLVNLHNSYKAGEKTYGYTYTLEQVK